MKEIEENGEDAILDININTPITPITPITIAKPLDV
jgi:hypothetical protein